MRRFLLLGLGTFLLTLGAAQAQETPEDPPARPQATDVPPPQLEPTAEEVAIARARKAILRDLRARQRIDGSLDAETIVDVVETPLNDVLRDLSKEHGLTIVLDPEGIVQAGVAADQLVNLHLKGISLRSALRILLQPLYLTFAIRNEVLVVTSLDCPEHQATIRIFPVADLVQRIDDPYELVTALELVLPDSARTDPETQCKPRFRLIAGHLVVRGSPRHHDLAEQFIEGILLGSSPAEAAAGAKPVVRIIELTPGAKPELKPLPRPQPEAPDPLE